MASSFAVTLTFPKNGDPFETAIWKDNREFPFELAIRHYHTGRRSL
jgi:hypothetical protein